MNTQHHTRLWMSAMALLLSIGQGCTSHTVGYTVDSESGPNGMEEMAMANQEGNPAYGSGEYEKGRSFYESGESYDPGAVGSTRGYRLPGSPDGTDVSNGAYGQGGMQYFEPGTDPNSAMSNYGHNYSGAPGYGSNNGPVTGFGSGYAESMNPNPEAWAEAFLRGNNSGESMSNGGLTSEHVGQDVMVAKSNPYGSSGQNGMMQQSQGAYGSSMNGNYRGVNGDVQDVYFAFDSWKISKDGAYSLESGAEWLKANPGQQVTIEGHCDQRGTEDYNMVLGKKRAEAAREYLIDLGVRPSQIKIVSYGKERPFCSELNEACYQQNRRGHMSVQN